jgi:hypothetical protein
MKAIGVLIGLGLLGAGIAAVTVYKGTHDVTLRKGGAYKVSNTDQQELEQAGFASVVPTDEPQTYQAIWAGVDGTEWTPPMGVTVEYLGMASGIRATPGSINPATVRANPITYNVNLGQVGPGWVSPPEGPPASLIAKPDGWPITMAWPPPPPGYWPKNIPWPPVASPFEPWGWPSQYDWPPGVPTYAPTYWPIAVPFPVQLPSNSPTNIPVSPFPFG